MNDEIKIRQSQALFPFGVGAILDHQGQSFIACDITRWSLATKLHEERLEALLKVKEFRSPPIYDQDNVNAGVPFYRFPKWLFCSKCRRMRYFRFKDENGEHPKCIHCDQLLTPMRFVLVCKDGHIDDVRWDFWAHRNSKKKCENRQNLEFTMKKNARDRGSLDSLIVRCLSCDSENDLGVIMSPHLNLKCPGNHPWRFRSDQVDCDADTRILQRGASNLRYSFTVEAISIPPWTDFEYWGNEAQRVRNHDDFNTLCRSIGSPVFEVLADQIADELDLDGEFVEQVAQTEEDPREGIKTEDSNIEFDEYKALTGKERSYHPLDKFQKKNVNIELFLDNLGKNEDPEGIMERLAGYINSISVVSRLRCVRVLTGYSRIVKDRDNIVPVDLGMSHGTWLPGLEFFGEGVFFEINKNKIKKWTSTKVVKNHINALSQRFNSLSESFRSGYSNISGFYPSPKFMLLHTLSHILMLRMQYVSGYSTSSIRERIYCSFGTAEEEEMTGILLFTSAGDVEGGMGGLARQGNANYFFPLLSDAIENSINCSYDPVCIESKGQGIDSLNMAACHSCSLVPETSCQFRNQFLDRGLLFGTLINPDIGFFKDIVEIFLSR
jgi:hypothetical protein